MKFKSKLLKSVKVIKAVSDPDRLAVLLKLLQKEMFVYELIKLLKIEPSLLSYHLFILREEGLVTAKRQGKKVLYKLAPNVKIGGKNVGMNLGPCKLIFLDKKK